MFVTSEAAQRCRQQKRKALTGEDLLWALSAQGFDKQIKPLLHYLTKYREMHKQNRSQPKGAHSN